MMEGKAYAKLCAEDFCIDKDIIWFVPINLTSLCGYSISENKVVKEIKLPGVTLKKERAFQRIVIVDDYVIGIPYVADYYFRYSIKTEELNILKYPWVNDINKCPYLSLSAVYDNKIFSFRRFLEYGKEEANRVIAFDYNNMELDSFWLKEDFGFDNYGFHGVAFRPNGIVEEELLIALQGEINRIIEIDLNKKTVSVSSLPEDNTILQTITKICDNMFCISDKGGNIWIWNRYTNSFRKVVNNIHNFSNKYIDKDSFANGIKIHNKVYFFPYFSNMILEYDIEKDILAEAPFSKELLANSCSDSMNTFGCENMQFGVPHSYNDKIVVWNLWNKKCYEIDIDNNKVTIVDVFLESSIAQMKEVVTKDLCDGYIVENGRAVYSELIHFIDYINSL